MLYRVEIHCFIYAENKDDANDKMEKHLKDSGMGHCPLVYQTKQGQDEIRFENMGATCYPLKTCKCGNEFPADMKGDLCYNCTREEYHTFQDEIPWSK